MSGQRHELAAAATIGSLASICAVALLGTSAWLLATAAQQPPVLTLTVAAVMVRFFALGRAVFRYAERVVGHDAAFRGLTTLRIEVYQHLERIAPVGLTRFARGDLLSRLVADVDAALDLPLRVILPWVQAAVVMVAVTGVLAWILPSAGAIVLTLGVIAIIGTPWAASALASRAERRLAPQRAALTASVVTSMTACSDLLAFGAMAETMNAVAETDRSTTALLRREAATVGLTSGVSTALQGAAVCGALLLGLAALDEGRITPVWLAVVALLPVALFDVLSPLPSSALALQRLRGSAERLAELQDAPDPVHQPTNWLDVPPGDGGAWSGALEVVNLGASWPGSRQCAIQGISFTLPAGARLAIVGPSGAGKSTLAAVLMGFLDYSGRVRVDGRELRDCDHERLRSRIGLLAQRGHLFDTTVEENIRLGRTGFSEAQVWQAVERAQLADTVRAMPRGLHTNVGTFGMAISGGERQRVSIARLILDRPALVILDEPTEHLDEVTAGGIMRTLENLTEGISTILITHRLGAIRPEDHVLVLEQGRVRESGVASELRRGDGWFACQAAQDEEEGAMNRVIAALPAGIGVPRSSALGG